MDVAVLSHKDERDVDVGMRGKWSHDDREAINETINSLTILRSGRETVKIGKETAL